MESFYSSIKILLGIAVLYFLCDTLVTSHKFKPYVQLILGLGVAVTLINPIGNLLKSDWNIDFNVNKPISDNSYRENVENIWQGYSSDSLQKYIKYVLANEFEQYTFTVRTYREKNNVYRVYITVNGQMSTVNVEAMKKLISDKTGISSDYVNIYLQNQQIKEDTHDG